MNDLPAQALMHRLTHPDDLGHAVSAEVRRLASAILRNEHEPSQHWLYIAGPMSGMPEFNRHAFQAAHEKLQRAGFVVMNPALNGLPIGLEWHHYLRRDLGMMLACHGVALLHGWEKSRGARLEVAWADALKMPVRSVDDWVMMAKEDAA
jgi:hypothetical protein